MQCKLSKRLTAIVQMVDRCKVVAEIGTDHGKIPAYLVSNAIAQKAVASDISLPSLKKAMALAKSMGIEQRVDFRLGDGLEVLKVGEADTIIIAGIGGDLTVNMLKEGKSVIQDSILILQPMKDDGLVRKYLVDTGYAIIGEDLVEDRHKIYAIIKAQKGHMEVERDILMEIGPILYAMRHPLLVPYMKNKVRMIKDILGQKEDEKLLLKIQEMEGIIRELKVSRCDRGHRGAGS
ncbi:tRNA (adenine(22)-N(1))-methyltransferase [Caldanaerobius polysaccharolyticus]|uniref:tRNA (adenine(22)-N(1))-methyltransferase n=1 Tax=Caldanaerobius polysaccharolyticus TaxID=44256 RepID=UPI00054DF219|nr:class I SAM-dependent methyltransferase [Caldanaerobius polysaccharolyticus]